MSSEIDSLKKGLIELSNSIAKQNSMIERSQRALGKFEKALDEASSKSIDDAVKSLKALIKTTGVLDDQLVDQIKTGKQLTAVLDKFEDKQRAVNKAQREYQESIEKAKKDNKSTSEAQSKYAKTLIGLGVITEDAVDGISSLNGAVKDFNKSAAKINSGIEREFGNITSASARLGKELDTLKGKAIEGVKAFGSISVASRLVAEACKELYSQATRLTDKGLFMAMATINTKAITMMRMSTEEFEKLIDANRDVIAAMGGGVAGIDRFSAEVVTASKGLEYMGKEGKKAAAQFMGTFNRLGLGPSSNDANVRAAYYDNIGAVNKQFRFFQAAFGDTAEQFAEYYKQLLSSEMMQSKLNALDAKDAALLQKELMARTENLRVMGLSSQQIIDLNKRYEAMFNPRQNRQGEAISQRIMAKNALIATANSEVGNADPELAAKIQGYASSGALDRFMNMDPSKKADALANDPEVKAMHKDISQMMSLSDKLRRENGGDTSFRNVAGVGMAGMAGSELSQFTSTGDQLNAAVRAGLDKSKDPNFKANVAAGAGYDPLTGASTALMKAQTALRDTTDQVTSVLKNQFTGALVAAVSAAFALSGALQKAAIDILSKGMGLPGTGGTVGGGAAGAGGKLAGAARMAGGALAVGSAGAAGYAAGSLLYDNVLSKSSTFSDLIDNAVHGPGYTKARDAMITGTTAPSSAPKTITGQSSGGPNPSASGSPISPQRKQLLDFIGKYESGGSYNKIYGGQEVNLENMTIAEVYNLQSQMLQSQAGSKVKSSAIGKYQVINATLKEAVAALGLNPNTTKFNQATQDLIGNYLLEKRGVGKVESGQMSGAAFMSNVSKEWASLPKDASGAGAYDGFNGNKAGKGAYVGLNSAISNLAGSSVNTGPITAAAADSVTGRAGVGTSPIPPAIAGGSAEQELKTQTALLRQIAGNTKEGQAGMNVDAANYQTDRQTAIIV